MNDPTSCVMICQRTRLSGEKSTARATRKLWKLRKDIRVLTPAMYMRIYRESLKVLHDLRAIYRNNSISNGSNNLLMFVLWVFHPLADMTTMSARSARNHVAACVARAARGSHVHAVDTVVPACQTRYHGLSVISHPRRGAPDNRTADH